MENRNIAMLSMLYDYTANTLAEALGNCQAGKKSYNDASIKQKIIDLGQISDTLFKVYRLETMRAKARDQEVTMPEQQHNIKDPALEAAKKKNFHAKPNDFSQFGNPGDWTP